MAKMTGKGGAEPRCEAPDFSARTTFFLLTVGAPEEMESFPPTGFDIDRAAVEVEGPCGAPQQAYSSQ